MVKPMAVPREPKRQATPAEFKAMAHPLRLRILRLCLHDALTNKELADRLDKDPATVLHHVRMLVRTGFLVAEAPRTGARGALEKPYRTTGKSWVLSANSPEEEKVGQAAVLDALKAELLETPPGDLLEGARLGVQLSPAKVKQYTARIARLIKDLSLEPDAPGGERLGFYVILHRRA
jgi:DNA-binding transcriptional ArsR family regulator